MCQLFLPSGDTFSSCGGKKPKINLKGRDNMKHNQSQPTGGDGEWRGGAKPKVKSVAAFFQKERRQHFDLGSARSKVRKCSSLPAAFKGGGLEEVRKRSRGGLEEV